MRAESLVKWQTVRGSEQHHYFVTAASKNAYKNRPHRLGTCTFQPLLVYFFDFGLAQCISFLVFNLIHVHLLISVIKTSEEMGVGTVKFRLLEVGDFEAVVRIDEKVLNVSRREYYRVKFETSVQSTDHLPVSIVAQEENGAVVGFVLGVLFIGEYGLSRNTATLDTIGVDPAYQDKGIGRRLIDEFLDHLKDLGVQKVSTLVDSNDSRMTRFFNECQFGPSQVVNLERSL